MDCHSMVCFLKHNVFKFNPLHQMKKIILLIFSLYAITASGQQFFQTTPASQKWVDKSFKKLTRKQKIAQLMVVRLSDRRGKDIVFLEPEVTKYIKKFD